jgi:D-alanyl-D-alanine carboxypeptidase
VGDKQSSKELIFGAWPALQIPDFFQGVKKSMVEQKASFIEADLSAMKLRVYKEGELTKETSILTKGRPGSWWETPAGIYQVESKQENHFSSFGKVYLPWSLPFQGNFFIHGWPYYKDGKPVESTYSGGCIRLSTEDAKEVYALASRGMPVLVFEQDFQNDNFGYTQKGPELEANSYLAADLKNNFVFTEKNARVEVPIASLTKLMTAVVAIEYVNIEKEITIEKQMIVPTSLSRLKEGERISLYNLLYPLLTESSNEAAVAISYFLGPERFVALMNEKAKAVGMKSTHFTDVSGADEGNVSTGEDLFNFAKYLYNNRSFILNITKGKTSSTAYGPLRFTNLQNFNVFQDDPEFFGGKVGKTNAAKETMLAIFETKINNADRPLIIILLGSPDYTTESKKLLAWLHSNY